MRTIKLLLILFTATLLFSGTDGTVRGKVLDVKGEALPGAQVYISELGSGTMTDIDGNYILLNLEVGTYDITISMIGFATQIIQNVNIIMDQTVWLNIAMQIEAIEGEVIHVSAQKELVERGSTSKKVSISKEAIEALPIRDVGDLYSLQSGVVKVEAGARGGIPNHEERGLEEVHVRGGRTGEIAYMIDGLYIRNPIFGGIGNGTRLNIFAIKEFDWQPGGFNAEYGDAMSAVSNMHTNRGGKEFQYKFKYETSLVGASLGSRYDELRGYNDYSLGFGGKLPLTEKFNYWVSGQYTDKENSRVLEFDDNVYIPNDPGNNINRENLVQPWDTEAGFRGFGFDNTWDVFGNLTYKATAKLKFNVSYWRVAAHSKFFNPRYLYWDEGQGELFRDTERFTLEVNHGLSEKTFYTFRASQFTQDQFQGVRWQDSDNDQLPDWFEWSYPAGERANNISGNQISDPYNPDVVPYTISEDGKSVYYIKRDGSGPGQWSSGWYEGAEHGNYNWDVAEIFNDINLNGVWDQGEEFTDLGNGVWDLGEDLDDLNDNDSWDDGEDYVDSGNGIWDGPELVEACVYRDGSYWLTPEMYVNYEDFMDNEVFWNEIVQDPAFQNYGYDLTDYDNLDSLYFLNVNHDPFNLYENSSEEGVWAEGRSFGGHDRFFHDSSILTQEMRLDFTSQVTGKWKVRLGVDLKSHKLDYYEVMEPWSDVDAVRQIFAEQWDDFGLDSISFLEAGTGGPDEGEGNGQWDPGESFDDFNGNEQWDNYVEPMELAAYLQNTFEVPWMVINAGIRIDGVNYNTQIWSDEFGNDSPNKPWFWADCGTDGLCSDSPWWDLSGIEHYADLDDTEGDGKYQAGGNGTWDFGEEFDDLLDGEFCGGVYQTDDCGDSWNDLDGINGFNPTVDTFDPENPNHDIVGNGQRDDNETFIDEGEDVSDSFGLSNDEVFFKTSEWLWKVSPRIGFSHIITDQSTFTFNYGVYYQTPTYSNIYLNTNRQEEPEELFQSSGQIGNATMTAARSQAYEFAFNFQIGNNWGITAGAWLKDMDQMTTARTYRSGIYEYQISSNGDFGDAKGIDITVQNRGMFFTTMIQYTYSVAKANGEYDNAAFGGQYVDAPAQQFLMPFDRTHDLTLSFYTFLPFGINASVTGFFESGFPYTPYIKSGKDYTADVKNKYTKRSDDYKNWNVSLSKHFNLINHKLSMGLNMFNIFDIRNDINIHPITGQAEDPGDHYLKEVKLPIDGGTLSSAFFDNPWYFSSPRQMNFFIRIDFN